MVSPMIASCCRIRDLGPIHGSIPLAYSNYPMGPFTKPLCMCFDMTLSCKYMCSVLDPSPDFLLWSD